MDHLPPHADFATAARALRATNDAARSRALLQHLASHRLNLAETLQVDRLASRLPTDEGDSAATVRLALLSSATADHLAPAIRVAALRRGLTARVHVGGFGQFRHELTQPSPDLDAFQPQYVVLALTAAQVLSPLPVEASAESVRAHVDGVVDELRRLWRAARERFGATVIQQTFLNRAEPLFGGLDRQLPGAPRTVIARLNDALAGAATEEGVLLLDVASAAERDGLAAWTDPGTWFQGKLEIAPSATPAYGEWLMRLIAAHRGLSRKCLVLDLDNTIWGGVIGDDGLAGIVLGEGSAAGEAHLALQRYARALRDRGVILAVCSKNDHRIATEAFAGHPEMHLKPSDIAAFVANWDPKPENLRAIAAQLNIGLDSLVFVDDNPAERAAVREALPMVAVPELPADVARYVACLAGAGYFEAVSFTAEDRQRGEAYAANLARDAARGTAQGQDEFLAGLQMSAGFGFVDATNLPRVTQLVNKTNQFNTTTRRHTAEHIGALAADPAGLCLQARLRDRFGDNGLVAVILLQPLANEPGTLEIDTWVMSCRVFSRELEHETLNQVVRLARERGVRRLVADYIPTAKNVVVKDLYPGLGFTPAGSTEDGTTRWQLDLAEYAPRPTHILGSFE